MMDLLTQAIGHPSPFSVVTACVGIIWAATAIVVEARSCRRERAR